MEGGRVTDCCVLRLREVGCSPIATTIDPAVVRLTDCRGTERSREYTMHCCVNWAEYPRVLEDARAALLSADFEHPFYFLQWVNTRTNQPKATVCLAASQACSRHTMPFALNAHPRQASSTTTTPPVSKTHLFSLPVVLESHDAFGEQVVSTTRSKSVD